MTPSRGRDSFNWVNCSFDFQENQSGMDVCSQYSTGLNFMDGPLCRYLPLYSFPVRTNGEAVRPQHSLNCLLVGGASLLVSKENGRIFG